MTKSSGGRVTAFLFVPELQPMPPEHESIMNMLRMKKLARSTTPQVRNVNINKSSLLKISLATRSSLTSPRYVPANVTMHRQFSRQCSGSCSLPLRILLLSSGSNLPSNHLRAISLQCGSSSRRTSSLQCAKPPSMLAPRSQWFKQELV
jgi:hypothetical protein